MNEDGPRKLSLTGKTLSRFVVLNKMENQNNEYRLARIIIWQFWS